MKYMGTPIFPAGRTDFSPDVIIPYAKAWEADLILPIMDFYKLFSVAKELAEFTVMPWLPVDCSPLGKPDQLTLMLSKATPIAMSKFGLNQLHDYPATEYVPHSFDGNEFYPEDRDTARRDLGLENAFIIGICAANNDMFRKGFSEQLMAFQRFHRKHKDSVLLLHTLLDGGQKGIDLNALVSDLELNDCVVASDQHAQVAGMMDQDIMRGWYNTLDVLSQCSYGEGFGLPVIEAAACGTPAIVTDASAMSELAGAGWKVKGQEFYNPYHRSWWTRPNVDEIVKAYEKAYQEAGGVKAKERRERAVQFAAGYESNVVFGKYWMPVLSKV